jgi:queuine tRNA-ribosyltransferase
MTARNSFDLLAADQGSRARRGRLHTRRGTVETPAFMPVATAAAMKGLEPDRVRDSGSEVVLCNTFHLASRPGAATVKALGGLHTFMGWDRTILTDSGGYQVFSLRDVSRIDLEGVTFRHPKDGAQVRLTPESAMDIQLDLGSDIMMVFDECLAADADEKTVAESLRLRTIPWEDRCLALHPRDGRLLFGIGQGGLFPHLRRLHAEHLAVQDYDGFAIGGLSVGETWNAFSEMIRVTTEIVPTDRPRYLMGVGSLPEILEAVSLGVDMFDCVLPSRNGRNGQALCFQGPLRLRNQCHQVDRSVLELDCPCVTCRGGFSRGYLRHLFLSKEMLGPILLTAHNLTFMQRLMERIRSSISDGTFPHVRAQLMDSWRAGKGRVRSEA